MKYCKIKKNEQFNRLFKGGKRVFSPAVTLYYQTSNQTAMGVAISKKHGGAVQRNRIKRLVRQAFYNVMDGFNDCYQIIILPKVAENYSLSQFESSISACIKKVNSCSQK